jgi:hypothetical protein
MEIDRSAQQNRRLYTARYLSRLAPHQSLFIGPLSRLLIAVEMNHVRIPGTPGGLALFADPFESLSQIRLIARNVAE